MRFLIGVICLFLFFTNITKERTGVLHPDATMYKHMLKRMVEAPILLTRDYMEIIVMIRKRNVMVQLLQQMPIKSIK